MSRARKSLDDRLAELTRHQAQLEARKAALLNEKKAADRKRDARRKIIVGAAVLAHAELDPAFNNQLRAILDAAVQRSVDRSVISDLVNNTTPAANAA